MPPLFRQSACSRIHLRFLQFPDGAVGNLPLRLSFPLLIAVLPAWEMVGDFSDYMTKPFKARAETDRFDV